MKGGSVKIVVVGDGACGKTSLIVSHVSSGQFSAAYQPTVFEDFTVEGALVDGKQQSLFIADTAGAQDFAAMRPLAYVDADVFVVCYSVDSRESLRHIQENWIPELRYFHPSTPVLVVGCKKDLRSHEKNEHLVSVREAQEVAKLVTPEPVIECSAKTRENTKRVFDAAIMAATAHRNRRSNRVIQTIKNLRLVF